MLVLAGFAGLALCLGAIGIYGVVSYSVERRRREMGVRLALGATPGAVVARTITRSLISVGAGVLLGIPAALLAARLLRGMLFGVALVDPVTLVAVVAGLAGVALLASWLPARRVASIDPVATLRAE
jgi:ABC-type antimicrobial peptide transport system permease subunit